MLHRRDCPPLLAMSLLLVAGCGGAPETGEEGAEEVYSRSRTAARTSLARIEAGPSGEQAEWLARNAGSWGSPELDPAWPHGPTDMVHREGYVLQHSAVDKIAIWVSELVEQEQLEGDAERRDNFAPDPQLEGRPRSELRDYKYSGYDRGHMAPAGNQAHEQRLKDETFYLSNMAPQVGPMNQKIWRALETKARGWVAERGTCVMITGGLFYDPKEDDPATADGLINYYVIGPGQVSVPTHFFKIVAVIPDDPEKAPDVIAFVVENRRYPTPYPWEELIRSVDWIEERSGLDFFPGLDDATEFQFERTPAALWD